MGQALTYQTLPTRQLIQTNRYALFGSDLKVSFRINHGYCFTMSQLKIFINQYAELEEIIRHLMLQLCSGTCEICTACCCRADICEEAVESAFLSLLLQKQGLSEHKMDEKYGWLDLHGCSLNYGRPPVCYAYYCDELLARLPDDETRLSSRILGNLIQHIGEKALGEWHLVEIMNPEDLEKLDYPILFQRLREAQAAFGVIESFFQSESGRLSRADREVLSAISDEAP